MNSKQRAYLKSLAMNEDAILYLGKASLTDDLEADSIDLVELVMVFESEVFQTGLPDEEVERLTTVGEIVDYIHRKL